MTLVICAALLACYSELVTLSSAFKEFGEGRSYGRPERFPLILDNNNSNITSSRIHHRRDTFVNEEPYRNYYDKSQNFPREQPSKNEGPTKIFRTYGRGKVQVTRNGDSVVVPNMYGQPEAKNMMNQRAPKNELQSRNNRQRGDCTKCPEDQTVVATKGTTFVILSNPCPNGLWTPIAGPRPGMKIREGLHHITGLLGSTSEYCVYRYKVIVRHCEPLKPLEEDTEIRCSANDTWGSRCNIKCGPDKTPLGPTELECMDDMSWSHPVPRCEEKFQHFSEDKKDCSMSKIHSDSKFRCLTPEMTEIKHDNIPNGSTCRFNKDERRIVIKCKDGKWKEIRKSKGYRKKKKMKKPVNNSETNVCNPNPCQNGGTCLRRQGKEEPPICKCVPPTHGTHCEFTNCDYNICYNENMCLITNNERTCYCSADYTGTRCEYRALDNERQ